MANELSNDVLFGAFTGIETAHFFSAYLPSIFTIRHFVEQGDGNALRDLREGEMFSVAFSVGLGFVVSALVKSSLPVIFAIVTSVLMVMTYEHAINGVSNDATPRTD